MSSNFVPSWGAVRRLQALMALGWTPRELDARIGRRTYDLMRAAYIRREAHEAVRRVYDELWDVTPPDTPAATRMRRKAERERWPRPIEWDDDHLDLSPQELDRVLTEMAEAMTLEQRRACADACYRHGERGLITLYAARMYRRETADREAHARRCRELRRRQRKQHEHATAA